MRQRAWLFRPLSRRVEKGASLRFRWRLCSAQGGYGLERELMHLKRGGVTTLVSLLSLAQVNMLELANEGMLAQLLHEFHPPPLPDHELPPDLEKFRAFAAELAERVKAGSALAFIAGAALGALRWQRLATLVHLGWPPVCAAGGGSGARLPCAGYRGAGRMDLSYQAQA